MIDISFVVPSIRVDKWKQLYQSIQNSFSGTWEIIFVGPYRSPKSLEFASNVKCISDWGSPAKCRHIAILEASGKWVFHTSDDALFVEKELDRAFIKTKYIEGDPNSIEMRDEQYYTFGYHGVFNDVTKWLPKKYWLIQTGFIANQLLKEMGGLDCRFETCAMAYCDLSVRLQNKNTKIIPHDEPLSTVSHSACLEGDHAPIHNAMIYNDIPLFNMLYSNDKCLDRININLDNYKQSPEIWKRRFGETQHEK